MRQKCSKSHCQPRRIAAEWPLCQSWEGGIAANDEFLGDITHLFQKRNSAGDRRIQGFDAACFYYALLGQTAVIEVGGAKISFGLSARGRAAGDNLSTLSLTVKLVKDRFNSGTVKFFAKLKGPFCGEWMDDEIKHADLVKGKGYAKFVATVSLADSHWSSEVVVRMADKGLKGGSFKK